MLTLQILATVLVLLMVLIEASKVDAGLVSAVIVVGIAINVFIWVFPIVGLIILLSLAIFGRVIRIITMP